MPNYYRFLAQKIYFTFYKKRDDIINQFKKILINFK